MYFLISLHQYNSMAVAAAHDMFGAVVVHQMDGEGSGPGSGPGLPHTTILLYYYCYYPGSGPCLPRTTIRYCTTDCTTTINTTTTTPVCCTFSVRGFNNVMTPTHTSLKRRGKCPSKNVIHSGTSVRRGVSFSFYDSTQVRQYYSIIVGAGDTHL